MGSGHGRVQVELVAPVAGLAGLGELVRRADPADLDAILDKLLAASVEALSADAGVLFVADAECRLLSPAAATGIEGIEGLEAAALDGEYADVAVASAARLDDAGARTPRLWVAEADPSIRACASVPMRTLTGELVGALSLYFRSPRRTSDAKLRVLDAHARQAADVVEWVRSHGEARHVAEIASRRAVQLRGLSDAALAITAASSVDEVLRIVTETAQDIVGTHQAVASRLVHGWSDATTHVALSDKYARYRDYDEVPKGLGVLNYVTRENRPLRQSSEELTRHPEWRGLRDAPDHPPLPSYLAAPLVARDGSNLGLIQLSDKVDGTDFTVEDEAMLVQLAQMASGAIESIELLDRERQARIEAEEILSERRWFETLVAGQKEIFERIAQGLPLPAILEALVRLIERLSSDGVLAGVLLVDEEGTRLRHGAAPSLPPEYNEAVDGLEIGPEAASPGAAAFLSARVVATDIAADPSWAGLRRLALSHELRACASMPIPAADGRVLGTFCLYYRSPRAPSLDDTLLVEVFARAAAVAIERSRDLAQLVREKRVIETLHRVGQAISSRLSLHEVVQQVTDAATELTTAEFGAFFYNVLDEDGASYMLYSLSGAPREAFERFPMPRNTDLFDPTFRGVGTVRLADVRKDPRYGRNPPYRGMPRGHLPVRSYLAVPVVAPAGEVIGGLFFGHSEIGVFSEEHERLAVGVAAQAAIAIENARHYEREHRIAVTLQKSMLPRSLPEPEGVSLAPRYVPGSHGLAVGGDWYDALRLPDGTIGLSIGDVIGRGLAAATTMGQVRNGVRAYLLEGLSPADVVDRLNTFLENVEHQFATVVVMILDPVMRTLRFANAGHPPPLVVGPDGSLRFLQGTGPALLGSLLLPGACEERRVDFEPGSTLLLYTDGLVETRTRGVEEGLARLQEVAAGPAPDLDSLLDRLLAHLPDGDAVEDDVAVLGVRLVALETPRLALRLPADLAALRPLRQDFAAWLDGVGVAGEEARDLVLAVWEAAINAAEHPRSPATDEIELAAEVRDGDVVVVVRDSGRWKEQVRSGDRGRGLEVIQALVDAVTIQPGDDGTEVRLRRKVHRYRSAAVAPPSRDRPAARLAEPG